MINKLAGTAAALSVAGGVLVAMPHPAQASPAPSAARCVVGAWTLTSTHSSTTLTDRRGTTHITLQGGAGTRLIIGRASLSLDYSHSRPVYELITGDGRTDKPRIQFRGVLRVGATFSGTRPGTVVFHPKTATGNATARVTFPGTHQPPPPITEPIVKQVRAGMGAVPQIPYGSTFTCTSTTLTFSVRSHFTGHGDSYTENTTVAYRRT